MKKLLLILVVCFIMVFSFSNCNRGEIYTCQTCEYIGKDTLFTDKGYIKKINTIYDITYLKSDGTSDKILYRGDINLKPYDFIQKNDKFVFFNGSIYKIE